MTAIYHITHIRNLPSILEHGCLWCDTERLARGLNTVGIAHQHIKDRRARRPVPVSQRGTLADYVPFHFAPRSPMLYSIYRGNVEGYTEGQRPVLHLVSTAEQVVRSDLPFAFTNGHAEMATSHFYEDLTDLNNVDWTIMQATYWKDTPDDGTRKWRRQAEFLVHNRFPVSLIGEIGVISSQRAEEVKQILAAAGSEIQVAVRPNWYY
ncbi:MAG TPA: DUF4433 domain-containing protein [Pyrinomonadaceae bacterium]|nr:DUF4433 domain-containing protein [Pyrinomonadaceae bacterium]